MQSFLPDMNSKYLMYARQILSAIPVQKWSTCFGSLNSINALLPEEYQVTFSTVQYNEKVRENIFSICTGCKAEIDFKTVKIFELLTPLLLGFVSGKKSEKVWVCTECKNVNKLSKTQIAQEHKLEPHFNKVVPEPPERKEGLAGRRSYDRKVEQWVWACLNELDNQMGKFRAAYLNRDADGLGDTEIDTTIEEST